MSVQEVVKGSGLVHSAETVRAMTASDLIAGIERVLGAKLSAEQMLCLAIAHGASSGGGEGVLVIADTGMYTEMMDYEAAAALLNRDPATGGVP